MVGFELPNGELLKSVPPYLQPMGASTFEREIFVSFTEGLPQAHFVKHYDRRHVGQRPFDFEAFYRGCFFGIEAKHAADRLQLRRFHPHQRAALARVVRNGGLAFVLIRIEDTKKVMNKFRAFAITPDRLIALAAAANKVSVNANDLGEGLEDVPPAEFEATRVKFGARYGWDYALFFEEQAETTLTMRREWG